MKVIDLLNKIANREEVPEKFRFAGQTFEKQGSYIEDEDGDSIFDSMSTDFSNINEEIEIIEEDEKISKDIKWYLIEEQEKEKTKIAQINMNFRIIREKMGEIIDYINKEK